MVLALVYSLPKSFEADSIASAVKQLNSRWNKLQHDLIIREVT
jgi:outer membrane murein-binding lipoprotein Lpp